MFGLCCWQNIYVELRIAGEAFLESDDALKVDVTSNTIHLSQIFQWYRKDFGQTDAEVSANRPTSSSNKTVRD